jgi:hypothetical protein
MPVLTTACRTVHVMLGLACCVLGVATASNTALRFAYVAALTIPVLLAAPGVWSAKPGTLRWFVVLLVPYIGLGTVEVVASGGGLPASSFLGVAAAEFSLILVLLRHPPATVRRV